MQCDGRMHLFQKPRAVRQHHFAITAIRKDIMTGVAKGAVLQEHPCMLLVLVHMRGWVAAMGMAVILRFTPVLCVPVSVWFQCDPRVRWFLCSYSHDVCLRIAVPCRM